MGGAANGNPEEFEASPLPSATPGSLPTSPPIFGEAACRKTLRPPPNSNRQHRAPRQPCHQSDSRKSRPLDGKKPIPEYPGCLTEQTQSAFAGPLAEQSQARSIPAAWWNKANPGASRPFGRNKAKPGASRPFGRNKAKPGASRPFDGTKPIPEHSGRSTEQSQSRSIPAVLRNKANPGASRPFYGTKPILRPERKAGPSWPSTPDLRKQAADLPLGTGGKDRRCFGSSVSSPNRGRRENLRCVDSQR
jgi:hypothetical protein